MKKKIISVVVLLSCVYPSLIQAQADINSNGNPKGEVQTLGYIGVHYVLAAQNFIVHVRDVPKLDIFERAQAQVRVLGAFDGEPVTVKMQLLSTDIRAEVGVYTAQLGIEHDKMVSKELVIYVIDDTTAFDDLTVLFAQDFQMKKSEKSSLTAGKVKALAKVKAYEVISGRELGDEVLVDQEKMLTYVKTHHEPTNLEFSVASKKYGQLKVGVQATTIDDSKKGKLPALGNGRISLFALGLLMILWAGEIYWRKHKKEQK